MKIDLTPEQIKVIKASLVGSEQRANEKALLALKKDFHDAKEEEAFYVKLARDCRDTMKAIDSQTVPTTEDDEEVCPECGEDYGFCQCED